MIDLIARLRRQEAGTSLLELMFVLVMTAITMTGLVRFIMRARGSMSRAEVTSALDYSNQRIGGNLRASLNTAITFVADYGGTPDFTALHDIMTASINASAKAPAQVSFSAQPIVQDSNVPVFVSTSSTPEMSGAVGNEIFFVASIKPVNFNLCLSSTTTAATITSVLAPCTGTDIGYPISIDRVQFVAEYLAKKPGYNLKNGLPPLRLVEWRSKPYVRYNSLSESALSPGPLLTATCKALVNLGYTVAVADSVSDTARSFITFNATAGFSGGAAPATLGEGSWGYVDEYNLVQLYKGLTTTASVGRVIREQTFAGWVAPTTFSFAYNNRTSTAVPIPFVSFINAGRNGGSTWVPNIAQIDRGGAKPGFPGGFEAIVFGRPGAREVLVHYTTMMNGADSVSRTRLQFMSMDAEAYALSDTLQ